MPGLIAPDAFINYSFSFSNDGIPYLPGRHFFPRGGFFLRIILDSISMRALIQQPKICFPSIRRNLSRQVPSRNPEMFNPALAGPDSASHFAKNTMPCSTPLARKHLAPCFKGFCRRLQWTPKYKYRRYDPGKAGFLQEKFPAEPTTN